MEFAKFAINIKDRLIWIIFNELNNINIFKSSDSSYMLAHNSGAQLISMGYKCH
jgi:hypothetical protein